VMVNGQEHLGTIESERSNALERTVESGHAHASKTKETLYNNYQRGRGGD